MGQFAGRIPAAFNSKLTRMFTGIIEATAAITHKTEHQLSIARPVLFDNLVVGASISISGVCLSITSFDDTSITFDVVDETWKKSKLGNLVEGDLVNLERACLADSRLDGHVVQGHCEGVGRSGKLKVESGQLTIHIPKELNKFIVQKGSIALDGVSLTIAEVTEDQVTVALVPLTLENTTLGSLAPGDPINIETDIVGRYLYAFTHEEATLQR